MEDLFTIILIHYEQEKYIFEAIDSIINQNYKNIELIITDDCSKNFHKEKILKYIEEMKGNNIKNIDFVINSENLGTVKTLNRAVKKAKGKYITFFAADDTLNNEKVIENYVKAFKKYNRKIITGQCFEFDQTLKFNRGPYVDVKNALKNNKKTAQELYVAMIKNCLYAAGATAYETSIFKEYGEFDEKYKLVEDWTYWIFILKKGVMIHFIDYPILNHREGGVSHYNKDDLPPHVKIYYEDLINATMEAINDMPKGISDMEKIGIYRRIREIIDFYLDSIKKTSKKNHYHELIKDSMEKNINNIRKAKIKYKIHEFLEIHVKEKVKSIPTSNRLLYCTIILWILINCATYNKQLISTDNQLTYLMISFVVSGLIANILIKMGDYATICAPMAVIETSLLLKICTIDNIFILMAVLILMYTITYYLYFLYRAIKIRLKERRN